MVTKLQAETVREFHVGTCTRHVGPRGAVHVHSTAVRASGKCQTWKTRPDDFRLPIKHGLYDHGEITPSNAARFHVASQCPLALWESHADFVTALAAVYDDTPYISVRAPSGDELSAFIHPWAIILASVDAPSILSAPHAFGVIRYVDAQDLSADRDTRRIAVAPLPGTTPADLVTARTARRTVAHA